MRSSGGASGSVRCWAEQRLRRSVARDLENNTLIGAVRQLVRAGLPITAVLIAVNPIWGFSWYFNSENWATAAWQKIAESRVDEWREAMIDAAVRVRGAAGVTASGRLRGHARRHWRRRLLVPRHRRSRRRRSVAARASRPGAAGGRARDEVKFVVIASDVVYPTGAMKDYEANFYLPLMGVEKPILAIPGNHDWFNALDGFAANLMQPDTARAAIDARVKADLSLSSTTGDRIDRLIGIGGALAIALSSAGGPPARAVLRDAHRRLFAHRDRHRHRATRRRQTARVAQGGARTIEGRRSPWRSSVTRSTRPGLSQIGDGSFKEVHDLLQEQRRPRHDGRRHARFRVLPRTTGTHYFVNGGGGAYLSIGTALDWPGPACARRLRVLSAHRCGRRAKLDSGDAALEMAGLVVDPAQRRVAVLGRSAVGGL